MDRWDRLTDLKVAEREADSLRDCKSDWRQHLRHRRNPRHRQIERRPSKSGTYRLFIDGTDESDAARRSTYTIRLAIQ